MSESDRKPRYQTRLPADDAERVDEYVEANDVSQAEGVRRLIRAGLEAESQDDDRGEIQRAAQVATVVSTVLVAIFALVGVLILSVTGVLPV
jgi:cell division protein FtsX